ncbi:MAG: hypothetical protein D6812_17905 [Deltaproteobacteria bacterium]|nr:MAG: hypothetical protein D6812_17905 [Deltaproteobacteria bacterium]
MREAFLRKGGIGFVKQKEASRLSVVAGILLGVLLAASPLPARGRGATGSAQRQPPLLGTEHRATEAPLPPSEGEGAVALMIELADSYIDLWKDPTALAWTWGPGVFLYGLSQAAEVSGDPRYEAYIAAYLDRWIDEAGDLTVRVLYPDHITPAIVTAWMLERTGDPRYEKVCDTLAAWLMNEAPRAANGGWLHLPVGDVQYVDTLFMTTIFLANHGAYQGDVAEIREALRQHELLAEHLYAAEARLFWHGWDENGLFSPWATPWRKHNDAFWGRGNGWAVSALTRVLALADPGFPGFEEARGRLVAVLGRLQELQAPDGHWWTVVDQGGRPGNYTETTATALITEAACRAARLGLAPSPPTDGVTRALSGIVSRLQRDRQGRLRLLGASVGTNPSGYLGYILVPTAPDRFWGVGATLLLLAESSRAPCAEAWPSRSW